MKTETFEKFGKAALTENQVAGHKTRISALKKQVKHNVQALAMLETNRILERIAEEQYPLIRANITAEKVETESEIERLQEEIDGVARNKRWVNWIERFQKRLQEHKLFTPAQRKTFLEGMLTSIEVELVAPNVHKLKINFELPVVEDGIEYTEAGMNGFAEGDTNEAQSRVSQQQKKGIVFFLSDLRGVFDV